MTTNITTNMTKIVADIMETDVPTVAPSDPIELVLEVLRKHELPGVPVVDSDGNCVGIITDQDLVLSGEKADLHLPHYVELFGGFIFLEPMKHFEQRLNKAMAAKASDMMTPDPITISPAETVQKAGQIIAERKHNRLPVVEDGRFVGVVTRLDVLEALAEG